MLKGLEKPQDTFILPLAGMPLRHKKIAKPKLRHFEYGVYLFASFACAAATIATGTR